MNTESAGQVTGMSIDERRRAEERIAEKREKARLAKQRQRAAKKAAGEGEAEPTATVTPIRPEPAPEAEAEAKPARAARAASTAPKDGEMVCRVCARTLPATKFPTKAAKDGAVSRDDRCRECRDAARTPRS